MLDKKLIYFLMFLQILLSETTGTLQENSFLLKLVNHTRLSKNQNIGKSNKSVEVNQADLKCKYKCMRTNELKSKFSGQTQARFIVQGTNDSTKSSEMEAPAGKFSVFNLLSDDEEGEEDQDNHTNDTGDDEFEKNENEKEEEEEEEGNDNDDDVFNFFDSEEFASNNLEGTKQESLLKQYHRHSLRMHNFMFPLLLAYKLKFFTVIPLLLGSLILLVGTTGVAGFFFALFAAALGIRVKSHQQ